jgi:hypothetical protein
VAPLKGTSKDPTVPAVEGQSSAGVAVTGVSTASGTFGVYGECATGHGVHGKSTSGRGVAGFSDTFQGVYGHSDSQAGVVGESKAFHAVYGIAHDVNSAGIYGTNDSGSGHAGYFEGDVHVSRVLTVDKDIQLAGADLAEQFEVVGEIPAEPGCVVVLAGDDRVRVSDAPYDPRVAGVVSGAGSYHPALVLDSKTGADRRPLALTGKVWCKVDADSAPVEVGDLLTTSPTPGHAMRATDPARAFGAVIGKALRSLPSGRGLLPVLVALQ